MQIYCRSLNLCVYTNYQMQAKNSCYPQPYRILAPIDNLEPKGIALVIHGLNLNPERMIPICSILQRQGFEVVHLSLRGHGDNFILRKELREEKARLSSFKKVHKKIWLQEIAAACSIAKQQAADYQCPVYLIGYSLGGLLGCCHLQNFERGEIFDKMILFAPALSTRFQYRYLLKPLRKISKWVIPSLAPRRYRANPGTPLAGYIALQELIYKLNTNISPRLNIPTILFIHQKDELVSPKKLNRLIQTHQLTNWKVHLFKSQSSNIRDSRFNHLIIDEESAGSKNWCFIKQEISKHLSPQNS